MTKQIESYERLKRGFSLGVPLVYVNNISGLTLLPPLPLSPPYEMALIAQNDVGLGWTVPYLDIVESVERFLVPEPFPGSSAMTNHSCSVHRVKGVGRGKSKKHNRREAEGKLKIKKRDGFYNVVPPVATKAVVALPQN